MQPDNSQLSFFLKSNRNNYQSHQDINQSQLQSMPQQNQSPFFLPYSAFPANLPREYDTNIKQDIYDLVTKKYCPNEYIARYQQLSLQDPQKYPPLDENSIAMLRAQGPDISPDARDFEVARVYNKLEIEIFEMFTSQLPLDKQEELKQLAEQAQFSGANQSDLPNLLQKIRELMYANIPNVDQLLDQYMQGFTNQYLAGRY